MKYGSNQQLLNITILVTMKPHVSRHMGDLLEHVLLDLKQTNPFSFRIAKITVDLTIPS